MAVIFLCNGKKPECKGSPWCMTDCRHTKDPEYARNFDKEIYADGRYVEFVEREINRDEH